MGAPVNFVYEQSRYQDTSTFFYVTKFQAQKWLKHGENALSLVTLCRIAVTEKIHSYHRE